MSIERPIQMQKREPVCFCVSKLLQLSLDSGWNSREGLFCAKPRKKKKNVLREYRGVSTSFISVDPWRFPDKGDIGTGLSRESGVSIDGEHSRKSSINMPDTVVDIWLDAGTQNVLNSWKITKYPPVTFGHKKSLNSKVKTPSRIITWKVPKLDLVLHFLHPSNFVAFNSEEGLLLPSTVS